MMSHIIDKMIDAGQKVAEINPHLKIRYEMRENNEFLAAIDFLVIESLHSEMLGYPEKIRAYKLSYKDVSNYCWKAGKIGMLASIYVQVEVGQDDGFTADNEIVEEFRIDAKIGDMPWEVFFENITLKDSESIVWFADYLYQLSKIDSLIMFALGRRLVDAKIELDMSFLYPDDNDENEEVDDDD